LPVRVDFEKAAKVDPVRESKPVAVAKNDLDSIVSIFKSTMAEETLE